jgi:hypothetical protein
MNLDHVFNLITFATGTLSYVVFTATLRRRLRRCMVLAKKPSWAMTRAVTTLPGVNAAKPRIAISFPIAKSPSTTDPSRRST